MRFTCATCGNEHDIDEISFGANAPVQWDLLTDEERSQSVLGGEQCEIDSPAGFSCYVRGCLDIPVRGTNRVFTWGVWCSLSVDSYVELVKHWEDPERVKLGPYFGWLCTNLPGYPDTFALRTKVHQRQPGVRPFVELEQTGHPLAVEQREGIEPEHLRKRVIEALHGGDRDNPSSPASSV